MCVNVSVNTEVCVACCVPPLHSISMKARSVVGGVWGLQRARLSAPLNSVLAGWRGPRLANGCSGVLGYRTQLSFPPWRVPLSPRPREVSLLLPSPRHTPSSPSTPNSLLSYPPSATLSNIQARGGEGGGGFKDSLTETHKCARECARVCARSICQNSFSSVIGLGVPVSMR